MISPKVLPRIAALIACAVGLAGCISLLPTSDPVQLYRFEGAVEAAAPPTTPSTAVVAVLTTPSTFLRSAAGDRILTLRGGKAAYLAGARWVSPAAVLFDEALMRAFDADTGPVRLVARGEPVRTSYTLRLDMRDFYVVYDRGPRSAPEVVVRLRASVTRSNDQTSVGEQILEARVRATNNRVGAIVAAFDTAVGQVLQQLVEWANRLGAEG